MVKLPGRRLLDQLPAFLGMLEIRGLGNLELFQQGSRSALPPKAGFLGERLLRCYYEQDEAALDECNPRNLLGHGNQVMKGDLFEQVQNLGYG